MTKEYEGKWRKCQHCGTTRPLVKLTEDRGQWTCADPKECDRAMWGEATHMNGVMRP